MSNQQTNGVQQVVDSFNHGVLDIVSIWFLFCGIILFLGVEHGDGFVVFGWIITTIVAVIWLVVRLTTKQVVDNDQPNNPTQQDIAIDPQRLDGAQRLLNACDQCSDNNVHINHLSDKLRNTIGWIRTHNTQQYSNQIDSKLRDLELDAAELSIFLQFSQ